MNDLGGEWLVVVSCGVCVCEEDMVGAVNESQVTAAITVIVRQASQNQARPTNDAPSSCFFSTRFSRSSLATRSRTLPAPSKDSPCHPPPPPPPSCCNAAATASCCTPTPAAPGVAVAASSARFRPSTSSWRKRRASTAASASSRSRAASASFSWGGGWGWCGGGETVRRGGGGGMQQTRERWWVGGWWWGGGGRGRDKWRAHWYIYPRQAGRPAGRQDADTHTHTHTHIYTNAHHRLPIHPSAYIQSNNHYPPAGPRRP